MRSLIHHKIDLPDISLSLQAEQTRDMMLELVGKIQSISNEQEQADAANVCSAIQRDIKEVEQARKDVKLPVLKLAGAIDSLARDITGPLERQLDRVGRLNSAFVLEQRRVKEAEERRRSEEIARQVAEQKRLAQEQAERQRTFDLTGAGFGAVVDAETASRVATEAIQSSIRAPLPEITKAKGAVVKMVTKWEITDEAALFAARPDFFSIEPKRSAINACVSAKTNLPGLKVWEEPDTHWRAKR